ncbi:alpha/beta hydrolase family protein [Ancylobacter sp.]|uniref:alpha/beta hydrolase family protein n=1 Tax=Ancylobacter sp. TaxID=1872567 RepID=UPI003D1139FB
MSGSEPRAVAITCRDGVTLRGHVWAAPSPTVHGAVVVMPATGVAARYYHRYARFLAGHGFTVLTFDYRGIGLSRPVSLRGCRYRWRDWGERDADAALRFMTGEAGGPLMVVGHSIGGFLPGLAESSAAITRMLTMGAQYAWWRDYAPSQRAGLFAKWHLAMPVLTALFGYFPGKRLGWLEDLPAGVAHEWSFRGPRFETSHPRAEREAVRTRMAGVRADILAVAMADDPLGTVPALARTLAYYTGARRTLVKLAPADYGREAIGHFSLFHDSHREGFWADTLVWLRDGRNPWPGHVVDLAGR